MKFLKLSFFLSLFIIFSCDDDEQVVDTTIPHVKPTYIATLNPIDDLGATTDVSKNVIQGIASFENGWFVTQKSGNSILLINYLDENGVSLYHKRLLINSHGQDLSIEQISANELYLYTTTGTFGNTRASGILKLKVSLNDARDWSLTEIDAEATYNLNYTNCTPSLSEDNTQFAIRSFHSILIHNKQGIESLNFNITTQFELNEEQLRDNGNFSMFFQGIAMKDDLVYCLAGNEKVGTEKNIYVYNQDGTVSEKYIFDRTDFNQTFYEKFEPEGLTIKDNQLYFTIMTKSQTETGNIKYLYNLTL